MTHSSKELLRKTQIAWERLMQAEDEDAKDVLERRREWAELYDECEKRGIAV